MATDASTDASASVRYVGLRAAGAPLRRQIHAGSALRFTVGAGDRFELRNDEGGSRLWLLACAPGNQPDLQILQTQAARKVTLDWRCFDAADMRRQLCASGLAFDTTPSVLELDGAQTSANTVHQVHVTAAANIWCIVPAEPMSESPLGGGGAASLRLFPAVGATQSAPLPEALGLVRVEFRVDACTARAYRVRTGEFIQIIDVQGQQCSDFMAMREDALALGQERHIDATVTRTLVGGAYPGPGLLDKYFDQDMRPLLAVVQDTVGRHDTFALACTARGYEDRGFPGHLNCSDNISAAYQPYGIAPRRAWPAINLFFNSWILPGDNRLRSDEAWSRAGDYVVMRALTDLVCVTTACPDDVDPINAWNPTDIHVRIYAAGQSIPMAVAHRPEPTAEATMTQQSAFHPRTEALTRHFAIARNLWLPVNFEATRALEEYQACREAVAVQDLSSLRKYDVLGPDAERLLDLCTTRDVRRLAVNRGHYTLVCDEAGQVVDDGTLFRMAPDVFRWFPSSEHSALRMQALAAARGWSVWVRSHHQSMPNLAIQGPRSRELLSDLVFTLPSQPALASLKWFGFTIARLRDREGPAFMLTRSGYTGELGYEIFCGHADALAIWDAVFEAGQKHGLKPMGSEALGILRVEAGLASLGNEFGGDIDAFEAGLGFAVDLNKPDFIGKPALERIKSAPRRVLVGLVFAGNEVPAHGDGVFIGLQRVGTVTSATRSPALGSAIALARVAVEWSAPGLALEVGRLDGQIKRLPCTTAPFPFVDPQRERARS